MKCLLSLILSIISLFSYSQSYQVKKIVVDKDTKLPLENVIISNEIDISTTNGDGKFIFVSQKKELHLSLLGYTAINTTFDELYKSKDTIFMDIEATALQEVVLSNTLPFMKKVYSKMKDNYLSNYTANFFLRNILKKDSSNEVLQDIYAKENHNTSQKKKISIAVLNMRKTSLFDKKDNVTFRFPDFNVFFDIRCPKVDKCIFTEVPFNNLDFKKIMFESTEKDVLGQIWKGYFIINRNDYAIVEYSLYRVDNPNEVPFTKQLITTGKYRTTRWNRLVQFTKDEATKRYYRSNSKFECQVECFLDKTVESPFYYNLTMYYFVTNSPTNEKIEANFPADKDIFKAKFPYSKDFWEKQNQLPLTKELELFLKSVSEKKDKTKEYEVIGNF